MTAPPAASARILVIIEEDADAARLDLAAALARGLRLELTAVVLEQQALFDLLELPLAREVRRLGAEIRPLDSAALLRASRRREEALRARLRVLCEKAGPPWSLVQLRNRVGPGELPAEELKALRRSGDVLAPPPGMVKQCAGAPLLITPGGRRMPLRERPIAWLDEREDQAAPEPPPLAKELAAILGQPLVRSTALEMLAASAGTYSLLILQDPKAPLDDPNALLNLAKRTGAPLLLLAP